MNKINMNSMKFMKPFALSFRKVLIYVVFIILLAILSLIPFTTLMITSLQPAGFHSLWSGQLTFKNYIDVFGSPYVYKLMWNTLQYTAGALSLGLIIAIIMAFIVERTDMPFKKLVYVAVFLPMAMPAAITAIGWTFLLNPTNGIVNVFIRNLFHSVSTTGPFNLYSLGGMIFITGLSCVPTMFIMLSSVMRNLDPSLEEAANASGANGWVVSNRIILPLIKPGLLSVLIYFAVIIFDALEVPLVLGTNAKFHVLSVEVYQQTMGSDKLPNYGLASTFSMIILLAGLIMLFCYFYLTRKSKQYATVTGKGYRPKQYKLGKFKYVAVGFFALYFLIKLVLPLLVLLWSSLLPYFQNPSYKMFKLVSLHNYMYLFNSSRFIFAVKNTIILTLSVAIISMLLAAVVSWLIVRGRGYLARILDTLSFLPHLLPGIIIALALLLTSVGTPLYGTLTILIIGYIIRYIPFGVRTMTSVLYQISSELEEAAYASGASKFVTFRKIVVPLVLPALVNGILWVGSNTMRDLTLPLILISTTNIVIGSLIWETWTSSSGVVTAAITVLLVLVLLVVITPIQWLLERKMNKVAMKLGQEKVR